MCDSNQPCLTPLPAKDIPRQGRGCVMSPPRGHHISPPRGGDITFHHKGVWMNFHSLNAISKIILIAIIFFGDLLLSVLREFVIFIYVKYP